MKHRKQLVRVLFYVVGMLVLALGLTLNAKTNLGLAPVISLPYTVSMIFDVNFENTVFISYVIFVLVEFALVQKSDKLKTLLQIPISLLFTQIMNLFKHMIDIQASSVFMNLLLLLAAIVFTGVGAAMTLSVKLVPNPVDGVVQVLSGYLNKKVGLVKNVFDFTNAFIAFCLGWIAGNPLLGVGIGTIFCVLGIGRIFAVFNLYIKPWIQRQSGITEEGAEQVYTNATVPMPSGEAEMEGENIL